MYVNGIRPLQQPCWKQTNLSCLQGPSTCRICQKKVKAKKADQPTSLTSSPMSLSMEKACTRNKVEPVPERRLWEGLVYSCFNLSVLLRHQVRYCVVQCVDVRTESREMGRNQVLQSNSSSGKNAPESRQNPWGSLHGSSWRSVHSVCSWGWWKGAHRAWAAGSLRLRRCSPIHRQFINTWEIIFQITKEMELVFNNNPHRLV